ncbi:hypothetical protein EVAR_6401_1 [Eumeta japonica]|uniref:Uncharacterized protein n=1 Tax=Eumeta variegata TaxID=151549 RepID=A0A4C1TFN3_EUMVA|nr:hypothetical protein EVAR_6401_1 [Eumeta japonica]
MRKCVHENPMIEPFQMSNTTISLYLHNSYTLIESDGRHDVVNIFEANLPLRFPTQSFGQKIRAPRRHQTTGWLCRPPPSAGPKLYAPKRSKPMCPRIPALCALGQPKTAQDDPKQPKTTQNSPRQPKTAQDGPRQPKTAQDGPRQLKTAQDC